MSILSVYHVSSPELPDKVLTHAEDIASTLAAQGIVFEQLPATQSVTAGATEEEVITAYHDQIGRLMSDRGHVTTAVISVDDRHPQKTERRAGFLDEHRHGADELRFFVAGRGLCSFHVGDFVYSVLCEKSDLLTIPVGTRQWFDMGEHPRVIAVRLFSKPNGEQASLTGDDIAGRFARLEN